MKIKEKIGEKIDSYKNLPGKKKKKINTIIALSLAVILIVSLSAGAVVNKKNKKGDEINTAKVSYKDIKSVISASGTIEPIDKYVVTSLLKGDVLYCGFNEGDIVKKDDILYKLDTTDIDTNVSRAELSLERSKNAYNNSVKDENDLWVKSDIPGVISEMYVKKGDMVSSGTKIASVIDNRKMILKIPFNSNDAVNISRGMNADIVIESSFYKTTGVVKDISTGAISNDNSVSVSYVDIEVDNPGGITKGERATASIGNIACNSAGTFDYKENKIVTAKVSGEIESTYKNIGDSVDKNTVIVKIKSDAIVNNRKNQKLSLDEAKLALKSTSDQLDDYTIRAPISGTIIEKNVKAGDVIDNTMNKEAMCIIADLSTIIFTINVDELDVKKIKENQKVDITADALPDNKYDGYVNNININGENINGVTTYPVEIIVNNPQGLLPGMNVNAKIVIEQKDHVLAVPVSSVMRGDYVYVKETEMKKKKDDKEKSIVPDGFKKVKVKVGISDDLFVEIKSGLKKGDVVFVRQASTFDMKKMMEDMEKMGKNMPYPGQSGNNTPKDTGGDKK